MKPSSRTTPLREFLILVFFLGFPFLLIDFAYQYVLAVQRQNLEQQLFRRLDNALWKYQPLATPEGLFRRLLFQAAAKAEKAKHPLDAMEKLLLRLHKAYPNLFTFTLFDRNDKVVLKPGLNSGRKLPELVLTLFRHLFEHRWSLTPHLENDPFVRAFFGIIARKPTMDLLSNWATISNKPEKTWFFYHLSQDFSFFANIHRKGYSPMMALKRIVGKTPQGTLRLNLIDVGEVTTFGSGSQPWKTACIQSVLRIEREPDSHFLQQGRLCAVMALDSRFSLLASVKDPISPQLSARLRSGRLLMLLLFIGGMLLCFILNQKALSFFISIRWKLLALFLLSTGLPLTILAVTAQIYLSEREKSLIQRKIDTSRRLLIEFDDKLPIAKRICEAALKNALTHSNPAAPGGLAKFRRQVDFLKTRFDCKSVNLVDEKSQIIPLYPTGAQSNNALKIVIPLMVAILNDARGVDRTDTSRALMQLEMALTLGGGSPDEITDIVNGNLGSLIPMFIGPMAGYTYWDVVRTPEGVPRYAVLAGWEGKGLSRFYIRHFIPFKPMTDGTEIIAFDTTPVFVPQGGTRSPDRRKLVSRKLYQHFPKKPLSRGVLEFMKNVLRVKRFTHGIITYKGKPSLITGMAGNNLQEFMVFTLTPLPQITREIATLRQNLGIVGILCLVFTSLIGWLLATRFLTPVADLTKGMEAVRTKNFRHVVPAHEGDEFGNLSTHFNRMTASLRELDFGGQIQAQLFPPDPLTVGEYTVYGLCAPATELGGDYFDYLVCPNGDLLVLTGDVTGHGIPAALVMATAKAIVGAMASLNHPVHEIAALLNQKIVESFRMRQRRLLMTMNFFCLSPGTHLAQFHNFGHPYPIVMNQHGEMSMLEAQGTPLGFSHQTKVVPMAFHMEAGSRIFFYSDGMVEALVKTWQADAFSLFREYLSQFRDESITEACRKILENHPWNLSGQPRPDDFTIVILERTGKSPKT
jgi:serine phosphatase RsbU (regulator of sigma subunit)